MPKIAGATSGNDQQSTTPRGRRSTSKKHWTQTPEGKERMRGIARLGGRKRVLHASKFPDEKRIEIIREWQASNESAKMFAPKHGITKSDLYNWQYNLKRSGKLREAISNNGNNTNERQPIVRAGRTATPAQEIDYQHQNQISFAVGHCKGWLNFYAESINVPPREFARRVGELLYRSSHG